MPRQLKDNMAPKKTVSEENCIAISNLKKQLVRLGVAATNTHPEGLSIFADPLLPSGWVRIADSTSKIFGLPGAFADNLAKLKPEEIGEVWAVIWDSLGEIGEDSAPRSSSEWPEDQICYEPLEDGPPNDQPNTLIVIETNCGTRYTAGPHGVFACALAAGFDFNALFATREEAILACE